MATTSTERSRRYRQRQREQDERALLRDFRGWLTFRHLAPTTTEAYLGKVRFIGGRLAGRRISLHSASTADLESVWPRRSPIREHFA